MAQRSAEAAKEIKALIASSTTQVSQGVKLVADSGDRLSGIVSKVAEVTGLISEIAQSSQEQATGLNEVNSAINQMDQVTQQNAAMVEQATAAASTLRLEASELMRLVGRFALDRGAEDRSAPLAATQHSLPPRFELASVDRHAPVSNPVANAQSRIAGYARSIDRGAGVVMPTFKEF